MTDSRPPAASSILPRAQTFQTVVVANMDTVEERPYTPPHGSLEEEVGRDPRGTKTDLPMEMGSNFDPDAIDGGIATPQYSGTNPGALEAQEDLDRFARVHRVRCIPSRRISNFIV